MGLFTKPKPKPKNVSTSGKKAINKPTDEEIWFILMQQYDEMNAIKPEAERKIRDMEDNMEQYEVLFNYYNKKSKKWDGSIRDHRAFKNTEKFEKLKNQAEVEFGILNKQYEELVSKHEKCYADAEELRVKMFRKSRNPIIQKG